MIGSFIRGVLGGMDWKEDRENRRKAIEQRQAQIDIMGRADARAGETHDMRKDEYEWEKGLRPEDRAYELEQRGWRREDRADALTQRAAARGRAAEARRRAAADRALIEGDEALLREGMAAPYAAPVATAPATAGLGVAPPAAAARTPAEDFAAYLTGRFRGF